MLARFPDSRWNRRSKILRKKEDCSGLSPAENVGLNPGESAISADFGENLGGNLQAGQGYLWLRVAFGTNGVNRGNT
jgi:hypothetical protein